MDLEAWETGDEHNIKVVVHNIKVVVHNIKVVKLPLEELEAYTIASTSL